MHQPSTPGRTKKRGGRGGIYITLVRHGQSVANHHKRTQGQQNGSLTVKGRRQAAALGQKIKHRTYDAIYCSDLNRTRETCHEVMSARKKTMDIVVLDDLLREKAAGVLEGRPLGEAERMCETLGVSLRTFRPEGGECWADVCDRAGMFLQKIWKTYKPEVPASHKPHILAVTHGGFIKEFINYSQKLRPPNLCKNNAQNTSIFTFDVRSLDDIRMIVKNDCEHIRPGCLKLRDVPNVHEPANGEEDMTRAPPKMYFNIDENCSCDSNRNESNSESEDAMQE